jgi:hypothetical protein
VVLKPGDNISLHRVHSSQYRYTSVTSASNRYFEGLDALKRVDDFVIEGFLIGYQGPSELASREEDE